MSKESLELGWVRALQSMAKEDIERHARVGMMCRCGSCFTCYALAYKRDMEKK